MATTAESTAEHATTSAGASTSSRGAANHDTVIVVDFGAQYAQVIARRVRDLAAYSELVPADTPVAEILARQPAAVILSGGPASVYASDAPGLDPALFAAGVPVLGICYGSQLMASALGGTVTHTGASEFGRTALTCEAAPSTLLHGQPAEQTVWMSHTDTVTAAPPGFTVTASTATTPAAAFEDPGRGLFATQYHPEVSHTPHGRDTLDAFLTAAGVARRWTTAEIVDEAAAEIASRVGDAPVLCGLSGGVDSAVAAALTARAVGDQLTCVLVDHGLLRAGEADLVAATFADYSEAKLIRVDAPETFLAALDGVTDPEEKRRVIGERFIRTFEDAARAHVGDAGYLVQGTLYPDVVESGHGSAATIKSHHNVGGLPGDMDFDLVEPLRWLFKDEVRRLGDELGLPGEIVRRQPFPGPGLAVRILGEVTGERLAVVRAADAIVRAELDVCDPDGDIWQCFAVLPDIRSVGVGGDERTYAHPIIVRAVTSEDGMTADFARIDHDVLERITARITGEVPGVNRVLYDVTSKPPGTVEWE